MKSSFPCLPSPASTEEEGHASALGIFTLYDCQELKCVPPLPWKLKKLNQANYFSLESISDLSKLQILDELNLTNCEKVDDVPGLEHLKALKRLYMSGCNSRFSVAVKKRLSKASLKMMRNLSLPGNRIPDWFSQGPLTFSPQPNRELRGVILAVGVALNQDDRIMFSYSSQGVDCSFGWVSRVSLVRRPGGRLVIPSLDVRSSECLLTGMLSLPPFHSAVRAYVSVESDTRSTSIRGNETSASRQSLTVENMDW
ncbi:unnamed protein product [Brassica oleracea var. botrytis]